MSIFPANIEMKATICDFKYENTELTNIKYRKVILNEKDTGEVHISFNNPISDEDSLKLLNEFIPESEAGLVDPSKTIKMEYPFFVKVKNPMIMMSINDIMTIINDQLIS